jgi:hypothetical protein
MQQKDKDVKTKQKRALNSGNEKGSTKVKNKKE